MIRVSKLKFRDLWLLWCLCIGCMVSIRTRGKANILVKILLTG